MRPEDKIRIVAPAPSNPIAGSQPAVPPPVSSAQPQASFASTNWVSQAAANTTTAFDDGITTTPLEGYTASSFDNTVGPPPERLSLNWKAPLMATLAVILLVPLGLSLYGVTNKHNKHQAASKTVTASPNVLDLSPAIVSLKINRDTYISHAKTLTATGQVLIQNESDSDAALQVQTSTGEQVLAVNTKDKKVGIGTTPTGPAALQVAGDISVRGNIIATGAGGSGGFSLSSAGLKIGSTLVCTANGCISSAAPISTGFPTVDVANVAYLNKDQTFSGANSFSGSGNSFKGSFAGNANGVFSGDGSNLTNVNASQLGGQSSSYYTNATNISSGTLSDARLSVNVTKAGNLFNGPSQLVMLDSSGILPALNGSALTNVNAISLQGNNAAYFTNASNISSGTLNDLRLSPNVTLQGNTFNGSSQLVKNNASGDLPALSAINLTNLNATAVSSGTLNDLRLSPNVTLQGNTFNGASQLIQTTAASYFPALNGSLITNLNASNLATGTVNDLRLSTNVALLGAASQTFTGNNTFASMVNAPGLQTTSNGFNASIGFAGLASAATSYQFNLAAGSGPQTICTIQSGNCAGSGSGVTASGTASNYVPKFSTNGQTLGNSLIYDNGTNIFVNETSDLNTQRFNVAGGIQSTTGFYVGGTQVCNASGCGASSATAIQNGTALQANANYYVRSSSATAVTGILEGASGQTADILDVQNFGGTTKYLSVNASGVTTFTANLNAQAAINVGSSTATTNFIGLNRTVAGAIQNAASVGYDIYNTGSILQFERYTTAGVYDGGINIKAGGAVDFVNGNNGTVASIGSTGSTLFKNYTNSISAFQIQNALGTSNLFIADTTNTRIGIGAAPAYTLDVNGDINISTGSSYRINGVAICGPSATCAPASGSSSYIQNSVSQQANANLNIQSVNAASVVGIFRGAASQTADLILGQDGAGTNVFMVTPGGNVNITGNYQIGGSNICTSSGCTAASGSGNYIQNGTGVQTANYAIQSAAIGNIGALIRGAAGQTADLFQVQTSTPATVFSVSASGAVLAKNSADSVAAFQIQNAAGTSNLLVADTVNGRIGIGTAGPVYTLDVGGTARVTSQIRIHNPAAGTDSTISQDISGNLNVTAAGNLTLSSGSGSWLIDGSSTQLFRNGVTSGSIGVNNGTLTTLTLQNASSAQSMSVQFDGNIVLCNADVTLCDTNLYRSAAAALKTDGILRAGQDIYARDGLSTQVRIGDIGTTQPGILFGSANDTRIFRSGAGSLTVSPTVDSTTAFQIQNAVGTSNLLVADTTNNRIGIGQAPGAYKLTIANSDNNLLLNTVAAAQNATLQFADNGVNKWALYKDANNKLNVYYNPTATPSVTFDTTGNVGIGTASPGAKLDVNGTLNVSSTIASGTGFAFGGGNGVGDMDIYSTAAGVDKTLGLFANGGANLTVKLLKGNLLVANGNVGIGTASPQQALALGSGDNFAVEMAGAGSPTLTPSATGGTLATGTYFYKITALDGAGGETKGGAEASAAVTGPTGSVAVSWGAIQGATSYRIYRGTTAGGENAYYTSSSTSFTDTGAAGTAASPATATNAFVNKLTASGNSWLQGGNVGIGTANPQAKLQVTAGGTYTPTSEIASFIAGNSWSNAQGVVSIINPSSVQNTTDRELYVMTSATTGKSAEFVGGGSNSLLTILNGGNIGIGTASPVDLLHLKNTSGNSTSIYLQNTGNPGSNYYQSIAFGNNSSDVANGSARILAYTNPSNNNSSQFDFQVHAAASSASMQDALFIDGNNNGNIGINTIAPGYQLEVKGTGSASDGIFINTSGYGSIPNEGTISNKFVLNARGLNYTSDSATLSSSVSAGLGIAVNRAGAALAVQNNSGYSAIFESGNVGIGTTTPGSELTVQGTQPAAVATSGTAATQVLGVTGGKGGNTTGATGQIAGTGAAINITAGTGGDAPAGSTNGSGGTITLQGGAAGAGLGTAGAYGNIVLQASGGNVGIGTSSPNAPLEVYNSSSDSFWATKSSSTVGLAGGVDFGQLNSASTKISFGAIYGHSANTTAGSESGGLDFYTRASSASFTLQASLDAAGNFTLSGNGLLVMGTKAADPTCTAGSTYYNSTTKSFRGCQGAPSTWMDLLVPVGTVMPYAGSSAPDGFFIADGSAVSRTTYSRLFAIIGTTYGTGDGSTTFNLPDLRGRMAVGLNASEVGRTDVTTLGSNEGAAIGSRTPVHMHTVVQPTINRTANVTLNDPGHSHTIYNFFSGGVTQSGALCGCNNAGGTTSTNSSTTGITISQQPSFSASGGTVGPQSNTPLDTAAYLTLNYIIKF